MNSRFSAVLLAGGKSSRMGNDKALLEFEGELLWQRQLRILRELAPNELFIAGPHHAKEALTIEDAQPDSGPLAGVVAALRHCSNPLLLALAVDLPRMTSNYLRSLLELCSASVGAVPTGQPLCAVYPKAALRIAENCLAGGDYAMQNFATRCFAEGLVRQSAIRIDERHLFLNLNTPEDVQAFNASHA